MAHNTQIIHITKKDTNQSMTNRYSRSLWPGRSICWPTIPPKEWCFRENLFRSISFLFYLLPRWPFYSKFQFFAACPAFPHFRSLQSFWLDHGLGPRSPRSGGSGSNFW